MLRYPVISTGTSAAALPKRIRSLSALGIGLTRRTETLDCGMELIAIELVTP